MQHRIAVAALIGGLTLTTSLFAGRFDPAESLANYTPELTKEFKQLLRDADVEAGAAYFDRKCINCHDAVKEGKHGKGPLLWNLFGNKAGSKEGFEYSDAMKGSGHTWDYATLNYYLTRTDRAVPGRIMNFRGIRKDKQRADLLAYLRQFNEQPPKLP
ncbi:MAG: c-type cytochrome [Motiliproteus sp.]|nr:c-type cytochrome [Motiliproteus sp.]MCW9051463.1 c-type cytochrome [Motiliproteus sp.]